MAYKGIPSRSAASCMAALALTPMPVPDQPILQTLAPMNVGVTSSSMVQVPSTDAWKDFIAWSALRGRVKAWASLPEGWDGIDAAAPPAETVEAALLFMQQARDNRIPLPQPFIASDGEIGFRWARGNAFASVSFLSDGSVVGTIRDEAGNRTDVDQPFSYEFPDAALKSLLLLG
ncbi:hypothetical protein [Brevundimonas sp.]|uniref:hypothetical protein n=1 Tax=Brevundimonas sp. TaxID=1871086 RepID=UPI0025C73A46|nr:hypothetical protein [Brevundimonas sp.]